MKKIAIIIPHFNGEEILNDCLTSLRQQTSTMFQVYLVDNGSSDQSVKLTETIFPEVKIFKLNKNLGYSGGCNYGIKNTEEPYVFLLNNDTVQNPECVDLMLKKIEMDDQIAAVQPKLISFQNNKFFDYSGACGGEIDYLAYPFARGRIFQHIEEDSGQYDTLDSQIFWASGTAILLRRSALDKSGLLDDSFFAHMEEIDLCWRLQSLGYTIHVEPKAIVYHYSGYTLGAMNLRKMYLNHRNNLIMLYKNLEDHELFNRLLHRILFEFITIATALIRFDLKRAWAVIKGLIYFCFNVRKFKAKRNEINKQRVVANGDLRIYQESIIVKNFLYRSYQHFSRLNF